MTKTFKVRFSSIYRGIPSVKPVMVDAEGKDLLDCKLNAILKAYDVRQVSDEAYRAHVEMKGA